MKTIHIRFVKHVTKERTTYYIQTKNFFGKWKDIGYMQGASGGSAWFAYTSDSKKKLLKEVLEKYFKRPKKQVEIFQHPTLKIY